MNGKSSGGLGGSKSELLRWKQPRAHILGKKGLKKKEMKGESSGDLGGSKGELLGWKHHRAHILGKKGLKKKEMKEKKIGLSLIFVYLLFTSLFSSLLMVVFSLEIF